MLAKFGEIGQFVLPMFGGLVLATFEAGFTNFKKQIFVLRHCSISKKFAYLFVESLWLGLMFRSSRLSRLLPALPKLTKCFSRDILAAFSGF